VCGDAVKAEGQSLVALENNMKKPCIKPFFGFLGETVGWSAGTVEVSLRLGLGWCGVIHALLGAALVVIGA
jgi:hypothetical protein